MHINKNGFGSFGGNLLMKKKNQYDQYEVTNAWADIYFESGRQIVNNGVALNDTYCLIDTTYQKHYLKKYKEFKTNEMKSNFAFQKMISIPKIFGLFKCMKKLCSKVFSDKILFELHIQSHISSTGKNKVLETQINTMEQLKQCAYCFKKCDDVESLATHISEKYSFCKYFCPFCFYRAYTPHHVLVHQTLIHTKNKPKIIQLEYDEGVNDRSTEVLMVVDYNDFIMPYKCNVEDYLAPLCEFF
ncbi:Zinc finger C2H2-type [Cinara cedri]|uniref:Zinc finger C2H2-type n=1 Tax=Cinara cedri TaxID=506608 RepID=A0A5E4N588_9HEMI|nr:Zinc finger C2H2-type [Cinara cedri]